MKRILTLTIVLFALFSTLNAQNTQVDTTIANDTTKNNITLHSTKNKIPDFLIHKGAIIKNNLAADLISNVSRMLFWPSYDSKFVIGVTDRNLEHYLNQYFSYRQLHGRYISVVYVNQNSLPKVNLIYLTVSKHSLLPTLLQVYKDKPTVIFSEVPIDISNVSLVLVKTYSLQGDRVYTYRVNYQNLSKKKVIASPELKAYAVK